MSWLLRSTCCHAPLRLSAASPTLSALPSALSVSPCSGRRWISAPSSDPKVEPAASATGKTVPLHYDVYQPGTESKDKSNNSITVPVSSIVVCHGLFGSKQNWRSLGKAMASRFGIPVYALDLRNHGTSPHIDGLAYSDMAQDVIQFMDSKNLSNVGLIGHSMGGKVSMSVALDPKLPSQMLKCLVSVDMSAKRGPLSPEFEQYISAMFQIRDAKCKTRKEADQLLQQTEKDIGVRSFLLTNLTRNPPDSDTWSWRIPIDYIRKNISQIGDFPYDPPSSQDAQNEKERSWSGDTLFIKGTKSKYINRKNIPTNQAYFPNSKLVTMNTGHWCQAEDPNGFLQVIQDFLTGKTVDQTQDALKPRDK